MISACATAPRTPVVPPSGEGAAAVHLETVRADSAELLRFLRAMPKGADLHTHLSGAVYAESYLRWAAEDGHCLIVATATLVAPPCAGADRMPAAELLSNSAARNAVIDAWSMRHWKPGGVPGHEQFFGAFAKFSLAARGRTGDMLAEVVSRAATNGVRYMELMVNTDDGVAIRLGRRAGAIASDVAGPTAGPGGAANAVFAAMRHRLDSLGLRDSLRAAISALDLAEARQRRLQRCGNAAADAGCAVVVRYLYQVARNRPPEEVFSQILAGFELARMDRRIVGFNFVAPEHGPVAMRDFALHMAMVDHLHRSFPEVPITLHAGELTDSILSPAERAPRSHIRQSIALGHARRIGHGVDVLREADAEGLLREMADRRILVEIALSSNALILGVSGARHPLAAYLRTGVPFALVTDDEGIARSDMTLEYLRAVMDQGLDYATLKRAARNSLQYAFVEDEVKARLLRELELAFERFERQQATGASPGGATPGRPPR